MGMTEFPSIVAQIMPEKFDHSKDKACFTLGLRFLNCSTLAVNNLNLRLIRPSSAL